MGVNLDTVVARAQFELERRKIFFLDHEQAKVRSAGGRHERFFADRGKIRIAELQSGGAAPAVPFLLHRFQASLDSLVGETGRWRSALYLDVLVISMRGTQVEALEKGERVVDTGLQVDAVLRQVDAHAAFFFVLMLVVFFPFTFMVVLVGVRVRAVRYAVIGAVGVD